MPRRKPFTCQSVRLFFLLIFWKVCDSQESREEANRPPDGAGGDAGAFFALRSCHQLLHGDSGDFFSPDYLCSNPPLWCNWTIQVDPGKRIQLHLEDLSPTDTCHLKQDQIHVDEPAGLFPGHKVLQKCWREARFTSSSSTLYVVLLIEGRPSPPYRGFYGRYQAFGPPVLYNPQEMLALRDGKSEERSPGLMDADEFDEADLLQHRSANSELMYDYYDRHGAMRAEEEEETEEGENQPPASENFTPVQPSTAEPTAPTSTPNTSRSGRDAPQRSSVHSDQAVHHESTQQNLDSQDHQLQPTTGAPADIQRSVGKEKEDMMKEEEEPHPPTSEGAEEEEEEPHPLPSEGAEEEEHHPPPSEGAEEEEEPHPPPSEGAEEEVEHHPPPSEGAEEEEHHPPPSEGAEEEEEPHPHPNVVEPLSDHRGSHVRNHSETLHLPGDHLFEVAVEVNFQQDSEESWEDLKIPLLLSVKTLISRRLEALHVPLTVTTKRIKRLSMGALFILWLQIRQGSERPQVHSTLMDLTTTAISVRGKPEKGVVMSVSIADVNECGTQLVLCDINADCVNELGSYSCRCRPGFRDASRLGPGGTVCSAVKEEACSSGLSAETKGVYVLFFLLSSLILMLLAAAGTLYHRHHRGAFLVRCQSGISHPDPHGHPQQHHEGDLELPPPPPARRFREGWPQVKERRPPADLPLLRFSPLLPPEGYTEKQEGGKM